MSKKEVYSYVIEKKAPKDAKEPVFVQYSGYFQKKDEALNWYEKHGKWLEKTFNRVLILKNELETRWIEKQREELKSIKNGSSKSKENLQSKSK